MDAKVQFLRSWWGWRVARVGAGEVRSLKEEGGIGSPSPVVDARTHPHLAAHARVLLHVSHLALDAHCPSDGLTFPARHRSGELVWAPARSNPSGRVTLYGSL